MHPEVDISNTSYTLRAYHKCDDASREFKLAHCPPRAYWIYLTT